MELGNEFQDIKPDSSIYYHTKAEEIAKKNSGIDGKLKICEAILQMGRDYCIKSNYTESMRCYVSVMKILEMHKKLLSDNRYRIKFQKLYATMMGNIGAVHFARSDYPRALEYYFRSLKINEKIGNKQGEAANLSNIGLVYSNLREDSLALKYYYQSLKINEEIGNKKGQAGNLVNIGIAYHNLGDFARGLEYYFKALKLNEKIGNKQGQANNLGNIGIIYSDKKEYARALEYYFKALKIFEEIGDKRSQAINLGNIGFIFLKQKKYHLSEAYLKKAEKLNNELRIIYFLKYNYEDLSELCRQKGNYKEALEYYKKYIKCRDTIMNDENQKAIVQKELKFKFEKEKALKEKEHQKKLEIERKEREKQKIITGFVVVGLILVTVFSLFVINRLKVTRKQKNIIEKQKKIVEEQKLIVEEQKKLVEQKNKDILDSINYAKRIQNAFLPSNAKWKEHLPNSFVLYLPKEIVAGDFYWMEYANNYVYVAVADCTGHGVPGAMVSVVCSNALTKAVLEEKLTETDQILNRTRELVIEKLTSEDNIRDGMDVGLVRIEKNRNTIQFSGANRPLYLINHDKSLTEIKPDKQPIGRYEDSKPFSKQDIIINKGIRVYLTTDGYADQFGGKKGKKIGTKQFKDMLCSTISEYAPNLQKEKLLSYFLQWKGIKEQTDDITIIGIYF
ncbi:MAG: tetratricopeptide repeat protein [Bacteroidia bacterium]|nr:tetratricopeptide repeat protein [Bacteroidia bacterium]